MTPFDQNPLTRNVLHRGAVNVNDRVPWRETWPEYSLARETLHPHMDPRTEEVHPAHLLLQIRHHGLRPLCRAPALTGCHGDFETEKR